MYKIVIWGFDDDHENPYNAVYIYCQKQKSVILTIVRGLCCYNLITDCYNLKKKDIKSIQNYSLDVGRC